MKIAKKLVVDSRICADSELCLNNLGCELIKIPSNKHFQEPVSAHADMFCVKINDTLFIDKSVNDLFTFVAKKIVINREVSFGEILNYPDDVGFNCAVVGNNIICNTKHTLPQIMDFAKKSDMNIIHVNQGYVKCSTCIVDSNSIITEDESIEKAAAENCIDVLKISKGQVGLQGYDCGFIGGAGGLIEKNLLVFNGNISLHSDYARIKSFCDDRNVKIISLNNHNLYDIGSILRI